MGSSRFGRLVLLLRSGAPSMSSTGALAVVLQPWWPQPLARVPLALRDLVALAPCQRQCDHRRLKWTSANASRDTCKNDVRCNREWCRSDLKRVVRCHFV